MAMTRRIVNWVWEDEDSQKEFAIWHPFPDADATDQMAARIEGFLGIAPPLDILDVGCGNGSITVEFARRGYRMVAIDVATSFLAEAKDAALKTGVAEEFRHQRGSQLAEVHTYDVALALAHSIGFMDRQERDQHFSAIFQALRPGGVLLYTFPGVRHLPEHDSASLKPEKDWAEKDGRIIASEKTFRDGYRHEHCIVIDTDTAAITEYHERQRAMKLAQIIDHLKRAGFSSVEAFDGFDRTPATQEGFSVFVCTKQDAVNDLSAS